MVEQRERELEDMVVEANDALGKALGRAQLAERAHREASQRYSTAYAELAGLKADYLAAIAQADDWHKLYAEERARRIQTTDALRGVGHLFRSGPNLCWCPESWAGPGNHTNACLQAFAALSSSSATQDGSISYSQCCHCGGTGRERNGDTCTSCNGTCCSYHYNAVDPSCSSCRIA